MEALGPHLRDIQVPAGGDKVYKDECLYSFDTPESEDGLFVSLKTFMGIGKPYLPYYVEKTGSKVFLQIKRIKTKRPPEEEAEPEKKIARLAIGVEGGFNSNASRKKYDITEEYRIIIYPEFTAFNYPDIQLPDIITMSVDGILKAESPTHMAELEAASQCWDGEILQVSKFSENLVQLDNGIKIPPSGWKCSNCDKTDNLWLNLTDGSIMCGRRQLDGSGGNNHAIEHYERTKYPLSVKLGTITPDGKADVFSYEENDMVSNPNLVRHLAHFGINVSQMEKTEKTLTELEIDLNQRAWEWSRITEAGSKLSMKFGPGFTGLQNLGNSCYLNSIMQVLMSVPSFMNNYYSENAMNELKATPPAVIPSDFASQMIRLASGILSGLYSKSPEIDASDDIDEAQQGISPRLFRILVGKGHPEFSTKRQQDAMEFLEHVLKLVTRSSVGREDPGNVFKYIVEDKLVLNDTQVKLIKREDMYLPLPVPMEAAINKEEVKKYLEEKEKNPGQPMEEQVHFKVPFESCLSKLISHENIVMNGGNARKFTRLATFPDYLVFQLVKFGIGDNWEPVKYDVSVDMPDGLDLSVMKSEGLAPGETLVQDNEQSSSSAAPPVDETVLAQLIEMGFPEVACRKALILTNQSGLQNAMDWIVLHMSDPDFNTPLPSNEQKGTFIPNEEGLGMLMSLGFSNQQATLALKKTSNNVERAADWIFSHQSELDNLVQQEFNQQATVSAPIQPPTDGGSEYELVAFVSHMGTSIHVGHYVCHIKKDGEWTLFNDNKVLKSENPPKDLGYIYFYKRK